MTKDEWKTVALGDLVEPAKTWWMLYDVESGQPG